MNETLSNPTGDAAGSRLPLSSEGIHLERGSEKVPGGSGENPVISSEKRDFSRFEGDDFFRKDDAHCLAKVGPLPEEPHAQAGGEARGCLPSPVPFSAFGRPTVFTPAVVSQIALLLSLGFSRNQAASYLKIDSSSIYKACDRDPELAAELSRAEQLRTVQPQLTIIGEAQKNWRAAVWYLNYLNSRPLPLTAAEKEAQHRERIEQRQRDDELFRLTCLNMERTTQETSQLREGTHPSQRVNEPTRSNRKRVRGK